jgi:hypothetical protein
VNKNEVATKVMGWTLSGDWWLDAESHPREHVEVWDPCNNLPCALRVLRRIVELGYEEEFIRNLNSRKPVQTDTLRWFLLDTDMGTPICEAALQCVEEHDFVEGMIRQAKGNPGCSLWFGPCEIVADMVGELPVNKSEED